MAMRLTPKKTKDAQAFAQSLCTELLVKIYVVDPTSKSQPFLVQRSLLESVSDYFVKALSNGSFLEGNEFCLRCPEDDLTAWQNFLYWLYHHDMPTVSSKTEIQSLASCWVLGDKYCVPRFQDTAMAGLIRSLKSHSITLPLITGIVQVTAPGSKLRKLMIEEAVLKYVGMDEDDLKLDAFGKLDKEFFIEFLRAYKEWDGSEGGRRRFTRDAPTSGVESWTRFMVSK